MKLTNQADGMAPLTCLKSGVGHFSAMSSSVNRGGLHHFQDSLVHFGVNMELINVFSRTSLIAL